MGMSATQTVLYDGPVNVSVLLTGVADGPEQEPLTIKVDVAALNPPCKSLKIMNVNHGVVNGTVKLYWGNNTFDPIMFLAASFPDEVDYCFIGGMVDAAGVNSSGHILLSTSGFDVGSNYSIKLDMKKKF